MSALATPLPSRLRLVPAADGQTPAQSAALPASEVLTPAETPEDVPARPRLRLVAGGVDAVLESSAAPVVALQPELTRRPVPPRRIRGSASGMPLPREKCSVPVVHPTVVADGLQARGARPEPVEALAPAHPAVRARRLRRLRAHEAPRSARISAADHAAGYAEAAGAGGAEGELGQGARADAERYAHTSRRVDTSGLPLGVRRLLALGVLVLLAVVVVAGGIVASGFNTSPTTTTTAVVQSGQSLWDIAVATGAADVNEAMAQIVDLNGLTSSTLQAGQTLIVPAD
ncbi:LysM peptidoglycan-binding domain-containing protein [Actinomyces sp.]|uniref:LysM peptidoglycan-binding domain-containing protein n=1 Tax=Actinomyces sp. TaxID=29317 RepID=UPI0026DBDBA7|nr:LysM peptidoglycan-binding domain-containing protein [Actinomyces sp.]MDO4899554.1 LysM peptidoglycan-binding domain-containing protein [Actinomyces sp.]